MVTSSVNASSIVYMQQSIDFFVCVFGARTSGFFFSSTKVIISHLISNASVEYNWCT